MHASIVSIVKKEMNNIALMEWLEPTMESKNMAELEVKTNGYRVYYCRQNYLTAAIAMAVACFIL